MRSRRGRAMAVAVALAVAVLMALPAPQPFAPGDGEQGGAAITPTGLSTDLTVSETHVVEDWEVWGDITVLDQGRLVVPEGGRLTAENIILTGRSELLLNGGDVTVSDADTPSCAIRGVCQSFKVLMGSTLALTGTDGTASVAIDVWAQDDILIQGSTLRLIGGVGFSPSSPFTATALFGDISSGGSASLELKGGTDTTVIRVTDSTILVQGGTGGDAPDGQPPTTTDGGRGGGFSEGGYVLGKVGAGGDASVNLVTTSLVLTESKIWVRAGKGGDAGDGGDGLGNDGGAGGGGYSGGRGADPGEPAGMPGGGVYGQVGSGGDATFTVESIFYRQDLSAIDLVAGGGGNAGEGGNTTYHGGGGGGGYSGGGGGSVPQGVGGGGGRVSGEVGSGGDARFDIDVKNKLDMVVANVTATAGRGGRAGDGGSFTANGGGGGGGFSGGGGGGSIVPSEARPGNVGGDGGSVTHDVASGGDTTVRIDTKEAYLEACGLEARGGNGGDGGVAGIGHYSGVLTKWYSGGGGGSYSSGGGGGLAGAQYEVARGGSGGEVTGRVGDGGNTTLDLDLQFPTIHRDCDLLSQVGYGGLCWASSAEGRAGGEGSGRITARGSEYRLVPMSKTVLWAPLNGYVGSDVPVFEWMPVHGSTTHGDVTGYVFEMDDVDSFDSPNFVTTSRTPVLRLYELQKGVLYWHVRPLYSRPPERFGPWSEAFMFTHLNSPPVIDPVPQVNLTVKVPMTVDLTPYIYDPDDLPYLLTLAIEHPAIAALQRVPAGAQHRVLRVRRDGEDPGPYTRAGH